MASPSFGEVLRKVREEVNAAIILENRLGGKVQKSKSESTPTPLPKLLDESLSACKEQRKRKLELNGDGLVDDNEMLKLARHTRNYAIAPYEKFLHYVPRLVNVVTLAEAVPAEGSGVTYPLDLRLIASRCKGAFYAPTRFAAVQLAFSQPRSRILIFHTGRLVGTGMLFTYRPLPHTTYTHSRALSWHRHYRIYCCTRCHHSCTTSTCSRSWDPFKHSIVSGVQFGWSSESQGKPQL